MTWYSDLCKITKDTPMRVVIEAVEGDDVETVELIAENDLHCCDDDGNSLMSYVQSKEMVDMLLDVKCIYENHENYYGETALFYVMDVEVIEYMIQRGYDPFHLSKVNRTILFGCEDLELIQFLVEKVGINPNIRDINGKTALDYCADQESRNYLATVTSL